MNPSVAVVESKIKLKDIIGVLFMEWFIVRTWHHTLLTMGQGGPEAQETAEPNIGPTPSKHSRAWTTKGQEKVESATKQRSGANSGEWSLS